MIKVIVVFALNCNRTLNLCAEVGKSDYFLNRILQGTIFANNRTLQGTICYLCGN